MGKKEKPKLTNAEAVGIFIGCNLMPRQLNGRLAYKLRKIEKKTKETFEDVIELRCNWIKSNVEEVEVLEEPKNGGKPKKKKLKVKVDEQFKKFMNPLFTPHRVVASHHEIRGLEYEMTEEQIEEDKAFDNFKKIMSVLEEDGHEYAKYRDEINEVDVEKELNLHDLYITDFDGVANLDRTLLEYFDPILK